MSSRCSWTSLGEGDLDWPAVLGALRAIGYRGYVRTELPAGDPAYLSDVSARVDRLLAPAAVRP